MIKNRQTGKLSCKTKINSNLKYLKQYIYMTQNAKQNDLNEFFFRTNARTLRTKYLLRSADTPRRNNPWTDT
jgi:hypothetical protein